MPDKEPTIAAARKEWNDKRIAPAMKRGGERRERFTTSSGVEINREYDPEDIKEIGRASCRERVYVLV